jgi:subfamily B ATP-binding cassette protein MsbA
VALVGMSGGGKSTFVNLVTRFYEPQGGRLLLDGVPYPDIKLASLRAQLALVSQNVVLFDDTLKANIAYGVEQVDYTRLAAAIKRPTWTTWWRACRKASRHQIGENGMRLSGGQRQRVAIARAIYKDAPILILDEATSALDNESERAVQAALDTLMAGRTTFVVAHRLSTIERADRIVVMEHGRIVEQGTHERIAGAGGTYANLYRLQFTPRRKRYEPVMNASMRTLVISPNWIGDAVMAQPLLRLLKQPTRSARSTCWRRRRWCRCGAASRKPTTSW